MSDLAEFPMTWSDARPLCDSWAPCLNKTSKFLLCFYVVCCCPE